MDDEEREHYTKLLIFMCEISLDVVHLYFEIKILDKEEFFLFLDRCKHVLFHALQPAVSCCECRNVSIPLSQKPPRLYSKQFNLLFDIENSTLQSHHNKTIQHCLCKYSASRSVEVDSLDISLVCAIVKICCPSIHGNPQWIKDIKDTRNFLAHKANCRITNNEYNSWLAFVENATLDLAKVVSLKLGKMTQKKISDFNTVKDILASSNDDVCKRLESLVIQESKYMKKDILDYIKKYIGELSMQINKMVSEIKTQKCEQLLSEKITEESIETRCATSTLQTAQPQSAQSQNENELQQMKQYLQMIEKPTIDKARLEKVKNDVELLPLLQERDLDGIHKLSVIKNILERMNRNDLLTEVCYEKESVEAVDAKSRRPKSGN